MYITSLCNLVNLLVLLVLALKVLVKNLDGRLIYDIPVLLVRVLSFPNCELDDTPVRHLGLLGFMLGRVGQKGLEEESVV